MRKSKLIRQLTAVLVAGIVLFSSTIVNAEPESIDMEEVGEKMKISQEINPLEGSGVQEEQQEIQDEALEDEKAKDDEEIISKTFEMEMSSIDGITEKAVNAIDGLQYSAHVQEAGWLGTVTNGMTAGTVGQKLRMEAMKIVMSAPQFQNQIEYRAHVQDIGWQDWVSEGAIAGTVGQSKRMEALQIRLTGQLAEGYDIYYRVHSENFGWLGWAKNGEIAGTTGWSYAAEAYEICIVKKGAAAPGSTEGSYKTGAWDLEFKQMEESTLMQISPLSVRDLIAQNAATTLSITAAMTYNGSVTRQISLEKSLTEISVSGFQMDFANYGKFNVTAEFKKNGDVIETVSQTIGVTASEYNLAPLSATFPVVLFSLSLWDVRNGENGMIPTIVMLDRPSAYNWNELPEKVYEVPYLPEAVSDYSAYQQYVKDLYEVSPNSKFNLYINDITCSYIHNIIYANNIPQEQYTITLLSDGSGSFGIFNETYAGENPQAKHQELVRIWNEGKAQTQATGTVSAEWGWHQHWDCMYAVLEAEPGTKWWVARNNLFTTQDSAFTEQVKNSVTVKSVNTMLTELQNKGDGVVEEFKRLYNFNEGYFEDAETQGKKAMMLLGTYVNLEEGFEDYARLTKLYYGDEYLYYYKGHPNTPTGLWPSKQEELARLGIADVDSAIAAELILFFNPEISLSGYGTSTFNSASEEMACGLFEMNKETALKNDGGVDYSGIDWFASRIDKNSTEASIVDLCPEGNTCYLVEFSDRILSEKQYNIAVFDATKGVLTFYKQENEQQYVKVKEIREPQSIEYSTHVQNYDWMPNVRDGYLSGTTGEELRMEAMKVHLINPAYEGSVEYRSHVQNKGWLDWVKDGEASGTSGESLRMEAVQMKLTGEMAEHYDIYYRVHVQEFGWLDWAKNGEEAGTVGYEYRMEAIEIKLVEKGAEAPGITENPMRQRFLKYQSHIQNIGNQSEVYDGEISGTEGQALRMESIRVKLASLQNSSVKYSAHVQDYGWQSEVSDGDIAGTEGESRRLEAVKLRLTGEAAKDYDLYYQVHVQNLGWLDWAKNGEPAGSEGFGYRMEGIRIQLVKKGAEAPGNTGNAFVKQ